MMKKMHSSSIDSIKQPLLLLFLLLQQLLFLSSYVSAICGTEKDNNIVPINERLAVSLCSDTIIRVVKTPPNAATPNATEQTVTRESLMVQSSFPVSKNVPNYKLDKFEHVVTITTTKIMVKVNSKTNMIQFFDTATKKLITEENTFAFVSTIDKYGTKEDKTFVVEQEWSVGSNEGLYGGGEFQNGLIDFSETPVELVQFNTEAIVPFFMSTRGYGILWDNNGRSMLNPPKNEPISVSNTVNESKSFPFVPDVDGDYIFYLNLCPDYGCGMNHFINLTIEESDEGVQIVQYWDELTNLPDSISGRASNLVANKQYTIRFQADIENVKLYVISPSSKHTTTLRSRLGNLIDYYFVWNPPSSEGKYNVMDGAIAGYREITGSAPLYGKWAYGFWQCKEHYHNQTELLNAAAKFRALKIPVDAFVQDWHYWGNLGWGPHWDRSPFLLGRV